MKTVWDMRKKYEYIPAKILGIYRKTYQYYPDYQYIQYKAIQ